MLFKNTKIAISRIVFMVYLRYVEGAFFIKKYNKISLKRKALEKLNSV